MSLYRKYRPRAFSDVVGQQHIVSTLEQAVSQDKLTHAYLFAGPRGTGKTSVARILARHMLTRGIEDEKVRELIAKGVEEGNLVDLVEIDAASNRGIDDIRSLLEKIQFSPVVASAKVYIIDEVHMLTKEAFNALLKTLEEPPPYAFFILATTELHKIPATIQSRCQRFPFRLHGEEGIVSRLWEIAQKENISVEMPALRAIAHHVQGGMRDAISLLDQLRSLERITLEDVTLRVGETGHEFVEKILEAVRSGDAATITETVRIMEEMAIPLETFLRILLASIREDLHSSLARGENADAALHSLDRLLEAIRDIRIAPVPGLVLEAALLSLAREQGKGTLTASSVRGAAPLKSEQSAASKPAPSATASRNAEDPPADIPPAIPWSLESVQEHWAEILKETEPASVRMSLKNAEVHAVDDDAVVLRFTSSFHRDKVAATEASRAIEGVCARIFGRPVRLRCELDGPAHATLPTDAQAVNLAEAAAEIF